VSAVADLVRDAMVSHPPMLEASDTAQRAGEELSRDAVRAVYVCDDGRFVGVITRKTLVREIVAGGRDPRETQVGGIAEQPDNVVEASLSLEDGFRFLEERDLERVAVTEGGRLVGVLSRAVVQRRLAEDTPPPDDGE
jgi:CBS domain-containing protein